MRKRIVVVLGIACLLLALTPFSSAAAPLGPLKVIFVGGVGSRSEDLSSTFQNIRIYLSREFDVTPRYFSYNYPFSDSYAGRDTLKPTSDVGNAMRDFLEAEVMTARSEIVVIGHSLGGVVALLGVHRMRFGKEMIRRVITLDSPVNGFGAPALFLFCYPADSPARPFLPPRECVDWALVNLSFQGVAVTDAREAALSEAAFLIANSRDLFIPRDIALGPTGAAGFEYEGLIFGHDGPLNDLPSLRAIRDASRFPASWRYRLSGFVWDSRTGFPIVGMAQGAHPTSRVGWASTNIGGSTQIDGFWSTMSPPGNYYILFFPQTPGLMSYRGQWYRGVNFDGDPPANWPPPRQARVLRLGGGDEIDRSDYSARMVVR